MQNKILIENIEVLEAMDMGGISIFPHTNSSVPIFQVEPLSPSWKFLTVPHIINCQCTF